MYLPAISIGYAVPNEDFSASVHSVFQSALNLRLEGKNDLLTLAISGEGDLPQGIQLDTPEGFSFEDFRLGESVICREGILHFENNSLTVQLSGAQHWNCALPALGFNPATPAVLAAWKFVWEVLNERQKLSQTEILAKELFRESARTGVPRKAGEAMRALVDAARRYDLTNVFAVEGLIGLGSGLTPSGDDLLVGYLAGLWCTTQNKSERMQFITDLGKTIIQLSWKTNDISRTYLYHAVQGQVGSRLADLAGAICSGANPENLIEIAEAAFKVGHTSGMDAVTGLLIGVAIWTSSGILDFS